MKYGEYMKKIVTILSTLCLVLGVFITTSGGGFAAVPIETAAGDGGGGGGGGVGGGGGGVSVNGVVIIGGGGGGVGVGGGGGGGVVVGGGGGGGGLPGATQGGGGTSSIPAEGGGVGGGGGGVGRDDGDGGNSNGFGGDGGDYPSSGGSPYTAGSNTGGKGGGNGAGNGGDAGTSSRNGIDGISDIYGVGGGGGGAGLVSTGTTLSINSATVGGNGGKGSSPQSSYGGDGGGGGVGVVQYTEGEVTIDSSGAAQGGNGGAGGSPGGSPGGRSFMDGGFGGGGGAGIFMVGADATYTNEGGSAGGSLLNSGAITGGAGGSGGSGGTGSTPTTSGSGGKGEAGGKGGRGVAANNATITNLNSISGGDGGDGGNAGKTTLDNDLGNAGGKAGDGGHGIDLYGKAGLTSTIDNSGTISGGNGGRGGDSSNSTGTEDRTQDGGNGGAGGHAVNVALDAGVDNFVLTNTGTITGGDGGAGGNGGDSGSGMNKGDAGDDGSAGVGVRIEGNKTHLVTSGEIGGGLSGDGVTRAHAINIAGNENIVELQSGYSFTGNVVVNGADNILRLGGDADESFDVSKIQPGETPNVYDEFVGFAGFEKTGDSVWTLESTTTETTPWTVTGGLLNFADAGAFGAAAANITLNGGGLQWATGNTVDISDRLAPIGPNGGVFDTNQNDVTLANVISGAGGITKKGSGVLTLTGTNTYLGDTVITGGTLSVSSDAQLGGAASGIVFSGGVLHVTDSFSTARTVTLNDTPGNGIEVAANETLTMSTSIGGSGGFEKLGDGQLLLSTVNTYTGETTLTAGTLALSGTGSIASSSGLSMAGNTIFDISGGNPSIAALTVSGTGASISDSGNGYTLNISGNTITFDLSGITPGQTMLSANGTIDATGVSVALKGTSSLKKGDTVTLVDTVRSGSSFTDQFDYRLGRYSYDITQDALNTLLTSNGYSSFREASDDILNPANRNNVNIMNGSDYLDWLNDAGILPDEIADAYDLATINSTPGDAAIMLQQLYGGYAAYSNTALVSDANRFRRRWQGQNRFFLDTRLFYGQVTGQADAGLGTDAAFASPRYGVRDCVPLGQSRIWAGGFGTWAKQNERSNLPGYKYDSQGAVLGYEYILGNLNLGLAAAYSRGDLKVNDLRYKNEADIFNLALYGAYIHESGFYAEGGLGYGHAWNDYKVHNLAVPGGVKKAKYGSDAFTADLELGYIARLPQDFNLMPSVGIEYTYLKNGNWTETINNPALIANRFDSGHDNGLDIPFGLRLNKLFRFGCDGGFVIPEIRASYVYAAEKSRPSIVAGYAGTPGGAKMVGVDPGRNRWRVGAGLSGRVNSRVDFRVDYDFETRSGFNGHNLIASVGLSF